ncbi:Putative protein in type-1 retrotransposable element R1DM [Araneus ventricosus]|uniref:RNase H type-1 domain-containing protein n=1 Tax=Araneus ventricosus TaxID=182803 RepID=A0A4Y2CBA6_ARAVE|nr:Putative protein in type-1 retrotransposable element R1DM [Araneus ventricosus]
MQSETEAEVLTAISGHGPTPPEGGTSRWRSGEGSILGIIQSSVNAYRKEMALYKKLLLSTKRKAWESFCPNHNERFGFLFNLVFNRGSIENFNLNNDSNNTIEDKINYLMDNFFPGPTSEDNVDYTPIIGHVEPMVLEDIEMVINALKGGKAPGLDRIDFGMWRAVFIHDKEFILDLINICFKFIYFPEHLRNVRVFFLLKDGKDPGLCTSYRPVCLLPTLGKIIERLFLLQLNKWLDRNNIIHHNQYGFREGKSCDLAIHDVIETIKNRMPPEHFALVSLDIKSAFDTMNWPVLFKTFESYDRDLLTLAVNIPNADYEIYTDGSRIENETGFAVCILKDETNIQNHLFKLNTFNSVPQAELAAIEFAANWAVKEKVKVNIHTDSLSSISAINSANTRSEFVNKVKSNIFKAKNMLGLSWVKAHVGIPRNELADQQAKLVMTSGEELFIPLGGI